jgi:hypothetical protein
MTEVEWLEGVDSYTMLHWVNGRLSERRLRLFACACCRTLQDPITPERMQEVIGVAERYADGLARGDERKAAWRWASEAASEAGELAWEVAGGWGEALRAHALATDIATIALAPPGEVGKAIAAVPSWRWQQPQATCCALLRDVAGNPFRSPRRDTIALLRDDGTVASIARVLYDERRFTDLPILADALEDAGCTDSGILGHLRGPGPHVRGCWAVDLALGRS